MLFQKNIVRKYLAKFVGYIVGVFIMFIYLLRMQTPEGASKTVKFVKR